MKNQFSDITPKHVITAIVLILICGGIAFVLHYLITELDQNIKYLEDSETYSSKKMVQQYVAEPSPENSTSESEDDVITASTDDKGGVISISKEDLEPISIDAYNAILEENKNDKLSNTVKQLNINEISLNGVWLYYRENVNDEKAVMTFSIDGENNAFILTSYNKETDDVSIIGAGTYNISDGKIYLKYKDGGIENHIQNPIVIDSFTEKYFTNSDGHVFIKK